jgi:hypothetical protein
MFVNLHTHAHPTLQQGVLFGECLVFGFQFFGGRFGFCVGLGGFPGSGLPVAARRLVGLVIHDAVYVSVVGVLVSGEARHAF